MELIVFENDPHEFRDNRCYPIGQKLVDDLPTEWEAIESGVQEQGIEDHWQSASESEDLSTEQITKRIFEKIRGKKLVSLQEIAFFDLVCEFLNLCTHDRRRFTSSNYIVVMGRNGFNIPSYTFRVFDEYSKIETTAPVFYHGNLYNVKDTLDDMKESPLWIARQYHCESSIEYYLAVIWEILQQGRFIKQCECCHHWFVTEAKADEKYCKRSLGDGKSCIQIMRNRKQMQRIASDPIKKAKERARNRANSRENFHPGALQEYKNAVKQWDSEYKTGKVSADEYIRFLKEFGRKEKNKERKTHATQV